MNLLSKFLPTNIKTRKMVAVLATIFIASPLTIWGIYAIGEYGIALFILTPLLIGLVSTILLGHNRTVSTKEALQISFITLGVFTGGLILFAIEGLICIGMASPIAAIFTLIGGLTGKSLVNKRPDHSLTIILISTISIPITAFSEKENTSNRLHTVSTSLIINASIESVWHNVIEFPKMEEPSEFIFKTGISYPINSEIKGKGTNAIRYCNFNTGSFVEPITEWSKPKRLRFDVLEQPEPMIEYSLWDINAPHLHDYFVSERGEFKLTKLPNGQTELTGTTWYRHNIKPSTYWKIWSDWIIHKIHTRVLNHIKINAENAS
ncbi:hypothetical protein [Reichenbachiella sp. MSK19-1]|uniref:hypothetical protein n=1 Tax=Reichenbachiella sp. MSK19-1 TaxID=1897631 RepID=UPI000E6B93EF|nr:hypothetical protein [Reichenbachiella sp. MSK19-1]RJE71662.1 hypothetical protein BGP76_06125 [Reichenbachiella sp. MSK19-1]